MALGSEFRGILTGLSLAAILLLAVSLNLGIPGQELLQTLRFHIVAACLVLPVGLLMTGARLRSGIMAGLLLLSGGQGALVVFSQLERRIEPAAIGNTLSLLSFNILSDNTQPETVVRYLTDHPPQVAVLLEASAVAGQLEALRETYPTMVACETRSACDTAIFSTLPLLASRVYEFGPFRRHRMVTARVDLNGQTITIVAVHLSKPYFDRASQQELGELAGTLSWQKGPVILAGDFNSAAWSSSVAQVMAVSEMAPPPSFPATWPVELGVAGLPIDNMFSRGGAHIRSIAALPDSMGSNHRALLAQIDISAERTGWDVGEMVPAAGFEPATP